MKGKRTWKFLAMNSSYGKGKGIACYYKKEIYHHVRDVKMKFMQLSKFSSSSIDIIVLYRSQQGNMEDMNDQLKQLQTEGKPQLIIGDFNFCYMDKTFKSTRYFLEEENFVQFIIEPTHIEGSLLDQAYLRDIQQSLEITAETHSKYYTDHKGLALTIKKRNYKC